MKVKGDASQLQKDPTLYFFHKGSLLCSSLSSLMEKKTGDPLSSWLEGRITSVNLTGQDELLVDRVVIYPPDAVHIHLVKLIPNSFVRE